jgi:iron complex transport system substrate-binding protein
MSGFVRRSRLISLLGALALAGATATAGPTDRPERVVSINLCTDQLALMLAAPGQLISVSQRSHDPRNSVMSEAARNIPANGSGAEEVFLLRPDLVLAGAFTAPATVQMLRDLGIKVEVFALEQSLSDIPDRMAQMGQALGREDEATARIDAFNAAISRMRDAPEHRLRAALYNINGYTAGDQTMAGDILEAAGFANVATEAGIAYDSPLSLEQLIFLAPDVILQGNGYAGHSRGEETLNHPALRALKDTVVVSSVSNRDWMCGTPMILNAVAALRDLRLSLEPSQ